MSVIFEIGDYANDLVDKSSEIKMAKEFKFYPCEPIVIKEAIIEMIDDYNGRVVIELSNGHTVIYRCFEIHGDCGPDTKMSVTIERAGYAGYQISDDEFSEKYLSNYGGNWINIVMQCYMDYHKNN